MVVKKKVLANIKLSTFTEMRVTSCNAFAEIIIAFQAPNKVEKLVSAPEVEAEVTLRIF